MTTTPSNPMRFSDVMSAHRTKTATPAQQYLELKLTIAGIHWTDERAVQDIDPETEEPFFWRIDTLVLPDLPVEVHGSIHLKMKVEKHDIEKDKRLQALGYKPTLAFTNEEVLHTPDDVVAKIREVMKA